MLKVKSDIESLGRRCIFIEADLSRAAAGQECVEQTVNDFGGIDVLVHSAGSMVFTAMLHDVSTGNPRDAHRADGADEDGCVQFISTSP